MYSGGQIEDPPEFMSVLYLQVQTSKRAATLLDAHIRAGSKSIFCGWSQFAVLLKSFKRCPSKLLQISKRTQISITLNGILHHKKPDRSASNHLALSSPAISTIDTTSDQSNLTLNELANPEINTSPHNYSYSAMPRSIPNLAWN